MPIRALSSPVVYGSQVPRLFTPPLVIGRSGNCICGCALSEDTSYGFAVIEFADKVLGRPLRPWQQWVVIHAGELNDDGTPRFEQVLLLVARQNGKTHLLTVLILYWLFVEQIELTLGISTNLAGAAIPWEKAVEIIEATPRLAKLMPKTKNKGVYRNNNDQHLVTLEKCSYRLAAATRSAARGRTVWRLVIDELREQQTRDAYDALVPTMQAIDYAQCFFLTNQGDDKSVVLNELHQAAKAYIDAKTDEERAELDDSLCLIEYSAPEGCDIFDVDGYRQANPSLGYVTKMLKKLHNKAKLARAAGPNAEAGFRTEYLCQRVKSLNGAIDPIAWNMCEDPANLDKTLPVAFCLDISLDSQHATLMAAQTLSDGRTRLAIVKAWEGKATTLLIQKELPELVGKVKPRVVGWMPIGPAAVLATNLKNRKLVTPWLGRTPVVEITEEVAAVCMGFAEAVSNKSIAHSGDDLLTLHALSASKKESGDRWKFSRQDGGYCDATYAAAGAVHLAKTLPSQQKPVLISVKPSES